LDFPPKVRGCRTGAGGYCSYRELVMLLNREIVAVHDAGGGGMRTEAVFDLTSTQVTAVADALAHHRRTRFAGADLSTDDVLHLRALTVVAEQIDALATQDGHAVVRTDAAAAASLAQAVSVYLQERDVDGYQSPEERERLAALRDLADPLVELACELRRADRAGLPVSA
jgi:hypothetical protein